jgi:hypothetical protein
VDHNGIIDINDIQLTAGHWNDNGTWESNNNHNHLGQTWTGSSNPLQINGYFGNFDTAGNRAPLILSNSSFFGQGLRVESTAANGVGLYSIGNDAVYVSSAGGDGLEVNSAGADGVYVGSADDDGIQVNSADDNGVEVSWAADAGLKVDSAGGNGLTVLSATFDGVYVGSVGDDGLEIYSAGNDGVHVSTAGDDGVWVNSAGAVGVYGNTTQTDGEWGLLTPDKISGSNVTLSSVTVIARVTGNHALTIGDVVTAVGVSDPLPDSTIPLALVQLAKAGDGVIGVVEGRMALTAKSQQEDGEAQEPSLELRSADSAGQPGDYVALTVLGVSQVKVDEAADIQPGQRLTVSDLPGRARTLRTETLNGMVVSEGAPAIGIALAVPEPGQDTVPVFVTLR